MASGDTGAAFLTALDYRLELVENSSSLDLTNAEKVRKLRELERRGRERLTDGISVLIHEKASGVVVAGTGLEYKVGGRRAYQEWTWVSPDRRGAGLATYVKAVTYVHAIDHLPNIEVVETENAEENEAMWAVNEKLGFERSSLMTNWFSFYDGDAWRAHP